MDMEGNVWEWCSSEWERPEGGILNAQAIIVVRGNSWKESARYARSAYSDFSPPDSRHSDIGFRLVCTASLT